MRPALVAAVLVAAYAASSPGSAGDPPREGRIPVGNAQLFFREIGRGRPAVARDRGAVCVLAQRAGKPIGAMDAFFAATARVQRLTLVTRNDADFSAVGVELLNPWSG